MRKLTTLFFVLSFGFLFGQNDYEIKLDPATSETDKIIFQDGKEINCIIHEINKAGGYYGKLNEIIYIQGDNKKTISGIDNCAKVQTIEITCSLGYRFGMTATVNKPIVTIDKFVLEYVNTNPMDPNNKEMRHVWVVKYNGWTYYENSLRTYIGTSKNGKRRIALNRLPTSHGLRYFSFPDDSKKYEYNKDNYQSVMFSYYMKCDGFKKHWKASANSFKFTDYTWDAYYKNCK